MLISLVFFIGTPKLQNRGALVLLLKEHPTISPRGLSGIVFVVFKKKAVVFIKVEYDQFIRPYLHGQIATGFSKEPGLKAPEFNEPETQRQSTSRGRQGTFRRARWKNV